MDSAIRSERAHACPDGRVTIALNRAALLSATDTASVSLLDSALAMPAGLVSTVQNLLVVRSVFTDVATARTLARVSRVGPERRAIRPSVRMVALVMVSVQLPESVTAELDMLMQTALVRSAPSHVSTMVTAT